MANCFSDSGTTSTISPPTAISGADRGPVSTATGSATPIATAAAVIPASAAYRRDVVLIGPVLSITGPAASDVSVP